jgi:hypothetical protein
MKYLVFITFLFIQIYEGIAQSIKLPAGKKFKITTTVDNLLEISVMDQHMQMHSDGKIQLAFEMMSVSANGYTMQVTPTHMSSTVMVNGRDQKIDTDSTGDRNNPVYAKIFELMEHPQTIEVKDHKVIKNSQLAEFNQTGIQEDPTKFFLNVAGSDLHNGFQWNDSTISEKSKVSNQYIIVQITDSTVTVNVSTDFSNHNTVEQAGMTIEQNLKGYSTGIRIYRRQNGLLQEESLDTTISGSTETNEMSSPITMKLTLKSIVEN